MTMHPEYLKKYGKLYRTTRADDGIWSIRTRHKTREGIEGDVVVYDSTRLCAFLPPQAGRRLVKDMPEIFSMSQEGEDAVVVLFPEDRLEEVADRLRVRRRPQYTAEQIAARVKTLRPFYYATQSEKTPQGGPNV